MKNKQTTQTGKNLGKINFPNWDEIIYSYIKENISNDDQYLSDNFKSFFSAIEKIKNIGFGNHIAQTMTLAINSAAFENPEVQSEEIKDLVKKSLNDINEFYSVFELSSGNFAEIDSSLEKKLGISHEKFTIPNLFALNPEIPLYHKSDISHVIRWAGIAYGVLGIPIFKINDFNDYYKISFRIPTELSSIESIRNKKYITLEKKCFLMCDTPSKSLKFPKYHFDKWSIYDSEFFTYVQPLFVSSPEQGDKLNSLAYLMNAFLLDINPKYLLMINQKKFFDRNKEIANNINDKLEKLHHIPNHFTENQIADSFTKTIRTKVQNMSNKWDLLENINHINSDQQVLETCNKYGLTPIPSKIENLIYSCITLE